MSAVISRDEWIAALDEADLGVSEDPTAVTIAEFAAMTGLKRCAGKARLDALVERGRATRTFKWATNGYGRRHRCVAYRLTETRRARRSSHAR